MIGHGCCRQKSVWFHLQLDSAIDSNRFELNKFRILFCFDDFLLMSHKLRDQPLQIFSVSDELF